ncbi:MAG: shikimate dehydrogenase [Streptosporangiaceae bacterium]
MRAAVLGSPVGHSLSPVLHAAAYAALGLTWWRYDAIECGEAELPGLLDQCGPDWAGLSLTMPLKRAVLPLLDRADPLVSEVGGANTVLFAAAQRLGYNTDVPGMVGALAERGIAPGQDAGVGPALILGGGATACAALAAVRELGEREVAVAVRGPGRAGDLLAAADRLNVTVTLRPFEVASLAGAALIVSTVPAGVADRFASALAGLPEPPRAVFDVVYYPWPTPLANAATAVGAVLAGGFDLLLHQAAGQVELMTGRPAPVDEMRAAGLAALLSNPGSGGFGEEGT